jgi:hypothetical protein
MFATLAPWSAAQIKPLAAAEYDAYPFKSLIRIGMIMLFHEIEATPLPLLLAAAAVPATGVP